MPSQREHSFELIALRRARALTMYVACGDLERNVIQELQNDSLIVHSQESDLLLAPRPRCHGGLGDLTLDTEAVPEE